MSRARPLVAPLVLAGLGVALWRLASAVPINSDQASSLLEGSAIAHGNLLLHGWTLPPDSYLTSRLPLFALLGRLEGVKSDLVPQSVAISGTLLLAAGGLIAKGRAPGVMGWLAALLAVALLASQSSVGILLPAASDHTLTLVLLLFALLALELAPQSRWRLFPFGLLMGLAAIGDPAVQWIVAPAVALVVAVEAVRARRWAWPAHAAEAATALVAIGLAKVALRAIHAVGGFQQPGLPVAVAPLGAWPGHVVLAAQALGALFGIGTSVWPIGFGWSAALHAGALLAAAIVLIRALVKWFRGVLDLTSQVLVGIIGCNLIGFVVSQQARDPSAARYLLPATVLSLVLVARTSAELRLPPLARPALSVAGAGYLALTLVAAAASSPAAAPTAQVTRWLSTQGLASGYGAYWDATVITVASAGQVRVRPVISQGTNIVPMRWHSSKAWYARPTSRPATFLVYDGKTPYRIELKTVLAAFGRPDETHRFGRFTVLVWHHDLRRQLVAAINTSPRHHSTPLVAR